MDAISHVLTELQKDIRVCANRELTREREWTKQQLNALKHDRRNFRVVERSDPGRFAADVTDVIDRHVGRVQENFLRKHPEKKTGGEFGDAISVTRATVATSGDLSQDMFGTQSTTVQVSRCSYSMPLAESDFS